MSLIATQSREPLTQILQKRKNGVFDFMVFINVSVRRLI